MNPIDVAHVDLLRKQAELDELRPAYGVLQTISVAPHRNAQFFQNQPGHIIWSEQYESGDPLAITRLEELCFKLKPIPWVMASPRLSSVHIVPYDLRGDADKEEARVIDSLPLQWVELDPVLIETRQPPKGTTDARRYPNGHEFELSIRWKLEARVPEIPSRISIWIERVGYTSDDLKDYVQLSSWWNGPISWGKSRLVTEHARVRVLADGPRKGQIGTIDYLHMRDQTMSSRGWPIFVVGFREGEESGLASFHLRDLEVLQ